VPELPDLLHIRDHLIGEVVGRTVTSITIKQPVILRVAVEQSFEKALLHQQMRAIGQRGPFLSFEFSNNIELIVNLMLAGKLQHQRHHETPEGYLCCSLTLDDDSRLNVCDEKKMAKVYLVRRGDYGAIPKYSDQGIDILSEEFTLERFLHVAAGNTRRQVRAFINDHTALSAIGNAYADEILFEARIHPKTFVARLSNDELTVLYASIRSVMEWGIRKVQEAHQPIHVKVRDHMRVRNRKGGPCPRCGTTIRREGVRGYDVYFCPTCQPASRRLFIDWSAKERG
jgi:formamidopyrimidine-DNA glycosylase